MKQISLVLIVLLLPQVAQAQDQDIQWSGFAFWVQEYPRERSSSFSLKHAWLIGDKKIGQDYEVKAILAFQGPPKIIHTLYAKWFKPLPYVAYLWVGKFESPFGHGINFYSIDRNPTIQYSAIDYPVVARSHGAEVAGAIDSLSWKVAVLGGERLFGNIPKEQENQWDLYLRPTWRFSPGTSLGVSYCG